MALRPLFTSGLPVGTFSVDPTATFEGGMVGGLTSIGGDIVVTVSDGINVQPLGLIDDIKTRAFSKRQIDEIVIIPSIGVTDGYGGPTVNPVPVTGVLENSNIEPTSFVSTIDVMLNPVNGVITIPAGTTLNFDDGMGGTGFEVIVSYTYTIPELPGEDSTGGSGNVTLHVFRGVFTTDQFDPTANYPVNATLYAGSDGRLTTRENGPAIGMVTAPPTAVINELEFLFF